MDGISRNIETPVTGTPQEQARQGTLPGADGADRGIIDKVEEGLGKIPATIQTAVDGAVGSAKQEITDISNKTEKHLGRLTDPSLYQERIEIALDHKSYKDIKLDDAAKMIGYFTQKMQSQGFPWALYRIDEQTPHKKRVRISDLEALRRLQAGQEVLFQPRRNMKLDLSPESLTAVAKIGGEQLKTVEDVATMSKNTKVSPGNEGFEVKFGAPVIIKGFGELKLLHELYNPDATIAEPDKPKEPSKIILPPDFEQPKSEEKENTFGKTAHNLSYFTKKTLGTSYPWRFVKEKEGNTFWRVTKSLFTRGVPGALIGAGVGLAIGGPIGLFTRVWATAITLMSYGAMIGGGVMAVQGARDSVKGEEINAFETLARVLDKKPVMLQERKMHSINLPIMGNFTWYSDYGKGSVVSSPEELELFNKMQDQS